ncbi:MAG: tetratricopeptide repeat protein, partial [Theionarchaea archaeon]|nr:tetratricopeptide repeat protein [Theionarchaea archaeon]
MRPKTKAQMKENSSRILSRLRELDHEFPPWYRKLAVLTALTLPEMEVGQIFEAVRHQYPQVRWHPSLVEASLKILESDTVKYVSIRKEKDSEKYTLTSSGELLLEKCPFEQFLILRQLKDEFTAEFRTYEILIVVRDNDKGGISSGAISRHFQSKYGIRGNKRRAIKNTLDNMVFSRLLRVTGGTEKKGGHIYRLGIAAESLINKDRRVKMDNHSIKNFKQTVEQFFEEYEIHEIGRGEKSSIEQILDDLEQCKLDLSLRLPEEWAAHIVFLTDHLRTMRGDTWEKRALQCIGACILSRLLPSEVSVHILKDYPPPDTPLKSQYHIYTEIAREYYFNLTESYLDLKEYEEAFRSFDLLELLSWISFDFLILKGRITMLKCDMRKTRDARQVLSIFKDALKVSKGKERVIALFYMGLTQYLRGNFKVKEKVKPKTPEQEERHEILEKKMKPKTPEEEWEGKGAKELWESCLNMACTVDQEIMVRHNLANVYRMLGNLEKARETYERIIILAGDTCGREEFKVKSS